MTEIQMLQAVEIDPYIQHLQRGMAESGRNGDVLFDPRPRSFVWDAESARKRILASLARKPGEEGWSRVWVAWSASQVVGHINLKHRGLDTQLHRATLGMGIELPFRRRGLGAQLMGQALDWARSPEARLAWVDLGVLSHNEPARRLYRAFGFVEIGRIPDAFRVDGRKVEDVMMALDLAKQS